MKRLLCITLACALLCGVPCAAEETAGLTVSAPSAVLMHPSGRVLYEKNAHEPLPPASVTKVMTLLLIMEALDEGAIALDDMVTGSAHAASMGGSQIWLKEGEQLTVDEMIKCIVVASANDCAVAMAEHIAGSEEAFVERMNTRAQELGMENTHFVNCCGLDADGHLTTAYDIALMSAELIKHEKIFDYTLIWQDTIRDGAFTLTNTNRLIRSYDGMTGLKTGSTSVAGFCLAGTARRDGLDLIAVVMKADTSGARNADITAMLNYGFANFASVTPTPDQPLMPIRISIGHTGRGACRAGRGTAHSYRKEPSGRTRKKHCHGRKPARPCGGRSAGGQYDGACRRRGFAAGSHHRSTGSPLPRSVGHFQADASGHLHARIGHADRSVYKKQGFL